MSKQYEILEVVQGKNDFVESKPFDFTNHQVDPIFLSNSLMMTVHKNGWYGLSAPQVNKNLRVIYCYGFETAMFNPKIVDTSSTESYFEEASATFPNLILKIKRPDVVRVRWTNCIGNIDTYVYNGLTARIIQRKIDFLDGILPQARATKYHREQAFKEMLRNKSVNQQLIS